MPGRAKSKRISRRPAICTNCGSIGPFYDYLVCVPCATGGPEVRKARRSAFKSRKTALKPIQTTVVPKHVKQGRKTGLNG